MIRKQCRLILSLLIVTSLIGGALSLPLITNVEAQRKKKGKGKRPGPGQLSGPLSKYGIYEKTAPRAKDGKPVATQLPLKLNKGNRIAFIGATTMERSQDHGYLQTMMQQSHPKHNLVIRNLAWSADEIDIQPRPANFADLEQHLTHEKTDVIFAAYGYNESFKGKKGLPQFKSKLRAFVANLKKKAFNGKTGPKLVLVSPIANENIKGVAAADRNNANIKLYVDAMAEIANEQKIGFVDAFTPSKKLMDDPKTDMTFNGCHLTEKGYSKFAKIVFQGVFKESPSPIDPAVRKTVKDLNRQYFRRYRPVNTFYYVGGRNKTYGYLDFLPAMRSFDGMVANRDQRIWDQVQGKPVPKKVDDRNVPALPKSRVARGINKWLSAKDEKKAFKMDPRFEVNLFAGEEQFPDIANPIQMRWDSQGRLWVSCSTTYPHVYPGREPNDKLVILEDTDGDGKADKSTVFADDLHIPLSFEFGNGGVYVSEQPHLTFLKDTDGDGKADVHRTVLTGFGTEDSHHALHDFTWTPDGSLLFRESIFHHSQVETPYGPVRQQNSGWFRYDPDTHRLVSFGTYPSTNPWGVTFDDWGQHLASHPIYAEAFHSLDPPFPTQHPRPRGLQAYSGVCGQEFIDFLTFPLKLIGYFIKVRYKPTTRVEIHRWVEGPYGYKEEYVSDLLFSSNLSFIPVDIRFGPRGALYVCDWYNPVKGHMQYSLRDDRRDRHSGRIWRITAKGKKVQTPPKIAGASIEQLIKLQERREYRYRYWAKRELRSKDKNAVKKAIDQWVANLDPKDKRFRHHQIEAVWCYRNIRKTNTKLLRELLGCDNRHARAAAVHQLRYWHKHMPDAIKLLRKAANDSNGIVRMQAAIAASHIGTKDAFDAILDVFQHPRGGHLDYAIRCALGSHTLKPYWEGNSRLAKLLKNSKAKDELREPTPTAKQAQFDSQKNIKVVRVSCIPERMLFTVKNFAVKPGQPVKLVFINPDATDHNLVIVKPGALSEVGMAANEMAKDPRNAMSDFIPLQKKRLIVEATPMVGPMRQKRVHVLRFHAPKQTGIYPFVCTFPGHWVIMNGDMVVAPTAKDAEKMLASRKPSIVREWKMADFKNFSIKRDEATVMRGMKAFMRANCHQCHAVGGHGVNLGPDLTDVAKRFKGVKLLQQIIEPSSEIHKKYQNRSFAMRDGQVVTGVLVKQQKGRFHVMTNLLTPHNITRIRRKDVERSIISKISPMPNGLVNVLTAEEIRDLVSFLEVGYKLPKHLQHKHGGKKKTSPKRKDDECLTDDAAESPLAFRAQNQDRKTKFTIPKLSKPGQGAFLKAELIYSLKNKPTPQCHASTIVETPTGLVAAWFGGSREGANNVGIWLSRHNGKTWTKPVEVADGVLSKNVRHPCWNPVLFLPKRGPLMLFYKVGPNPRRWWGMLTKSDDGGKSWSPPRQLGKDKKIGNLIGPVRSKPIQLDDGSLLCGSSTEHDGWRVHFELSKDLGQTWQVIGPIHDGKKFAAIQPTFLRHRNKLQVLCRSRQGVLSQSWSADGGKTWSKMSASPLPNPNAGADAVTLKDGSHLLIYNHTTRRIGFPAGRNMLNIAASKDGKTWTPVLTLERSFGEYSYPAIIQTTDGLVHATYTYQRRSVKHVVIDPGKLNARQ